MKFFTKSTLVVGLLLLFSQWASAQNPVTIGTGTSTQRYPFGSYWGFERSTAIYQASEIGRAGVIDRLNWYLTANTSGTYGIRIYLKHTTSSSFAATSTFANETANAKLVYADSGVVPTTGSWFEFILDDTFTYYNSENLQVIVEMNTGGTGINNNSLTRYTSTASTIANTHQYWTADNNPPTGNGTRNSNRPNIQIRFVPDPIPDLNIPAVLSSSFAGCNVNSYDLQFTINNSGGAGITSGSYIRYGYTINGGSENIDSFQLSAALAVNASVNHTITGININNINDVNFRIWANVDADDNKLNDSTTFNVANPVCVNANYSSDFESGDGGWTADALWVHGTVSKGALSNPTSGTNGWITDAVNNYPNNANASLYSPYFDFTNVCTPVFSWQMRFFTETNWDGMILEATTDFVNWTKVTNITPAYNNTSNNGPMPAPKFSGNNNAWTMYTADLSAFKGNVVRLRFRFASDVSGTNPGFAIDDVDAVLFPAYSGAGMIVPDTMFQNALYDTEIQSTSLVITGASFDWKLDGTVIGNNQDLDYTFTNDGTFTLTHRVKDACGLVLDSVTKSIVIIAPTSMPSPDFVADANIVAQFGTVNYNNLTTNGASSYEWYVSPDVYVDPQTQLPLPSVSYDNGTSAFSKTPVMSFFGTGVYDVCLIAENALGKDTLCKTQYIQVGGGNSGNGDSIMCSGTGVNAANKPYGHVFDPGGPNGDYAINQNCSYTIDFACYDSLLLNFNSFATETDYDFVYVYDGDEATGTPLWNTSTFPNGMHGTGIPALNAATSGLVTIVFESDFIITAAGFSLEYQAVSPKTTIEASFEVADTLCVGFPVTFESTSTNARTYAWDFGGTGIFVTNDARPTHTYSVAGTYDVKLAVEGCAGLDTFTKTVVVIPVGQNMVDFASEFTTYTINDEVVLNDMTSGCITQYQWVIEPAGATFMNGSDQNAEAHVSFSAPGVYTVKLFTENGVSSDSMVKVAYLTITDICSPKVDNALTDMGISRVAFGSIDNSSNGADNYTDYATVRTSVLKGMNYDITIERPTTSNEISRNVWIDYNGDGDFDDAGELVAHEDAARTSSYTATIGIPRSAINGMVTMRVATSYRFQANDACGNRSYGETEDYRIILESDITVPVITLVDADTIIINRNDMYTEHGATATDNLDGNLTPFIVITQSIDSSVAGTYYVEYDVTDTAGNAAMTVTRVVIVLPDAPSITLNGQNPDTLDVFMTYMDPGVTALDFNNNPLTAVVTGFIDSSMVGTYTLTYTVTDVNGRSSSITRDVVVVDNVLPTATLVGADTVTVEVFATYNDPGIDISDNYCTNNNFYTAGTFDNTTLGFKTLTYTFEDCNGNQSSIDRVIEVVDTEAPVIELNDLPIANTVRQHIYTDAGYTVSDNYDPNNVLIIDTITNLDMQVAGIYTLQYRATDASGNVGLSEVRLIYVSPNVGIAKMDDNSLNVYPNPSNGVFNIATDAFQGEVVLTVYDMYGKSVQVNTLNFNRASQIDLSTLAKGTYVLRLTQNGETATARVVIR